MRFPYPFGMKMEGIGSSTVTNKYTYNYKELNEDFGLNWHDYGARWYDAALGRWWSADPMAEPQANYSPYAYTYNNPLAFIDPTGMMGESADGLSNDQWLDRTRKDGGHWEQAKKDMKINTNRAIQDLNGNTRFIGDDDLDEGAQVMPYGTRVYMGGVLIFDSGVEGYYIQKGNYGRRQSAAPEVCVPCLVVIIAALVTAPEVATNSTGNYEEDAVVIQEAQSMKNEWLLSGLTAPVRAEGYLLRTASKVLTAKESKKSGKERSTEIPSWAAGRKPLSNENGKDFAKRLCDERFGAGNYGTGPTSDYNKLKKYGDRSK